MADRTYVFRLRGDSGDFIASTESAGKAVEQLGAKAGVAGREAAKGFDLNGESARQAGLHVEGFGFKTAGAKRELLVLAHELSQGNYKNFAGSMLVLGERTGAASLLFSGLGITALATTGALIGVALAAAHGAIEQDKFNKSLQLTGNAAGVTNDSVAELTKTLAANSGVTQGQSRALIETLTAQGDIGPKLIVPLGNAMLRVQKLTGETTEQIAQQFRDLPKEPTKAALKLNESFNFLDSATYEHIHRLEEMGDKQGAAVAAADALSEALTSRQAPALGLVAQGMEAVARSASRISGWFRSLGAEQTFEAKLDSLYTKLKQLENEAANPTLLTRLGAVFGIKAGSENEEAKEATRAQIAATVRQRVEADNKARRDATDAETKREGVAARVALDHIDERIKGTTRLQKALADLAKQEDAELKDLQRSNPNAVIDAATHNARVAQLRKDNTPRGGSADPGGGLLREIAAEREQIALEQQRVDGGGKVDQVQKFLAVSGEKLAQINGKISESERQRIVTGLAAIDAANKRLKVDQLALIVADDQIKQSEQAQKLADEATNAVDKYVAAQDKEIANIRLETELTGKSALARAELAAAQKADQQYAAADHELALLQRKSVEEGNVEALNGLSLQRRALKDQAAVIRDDVITAVDERFAKENAGYAGLEVALQKYRDDAANSSHFAQEVVGGGLSRLEDALTTFAETGKVKLGGLFRFMADEFIRNWIRLQIAQQTTSGGGGGILGLIATFATYLGSGGANGTGDSSVNYSHEGRHAALGGDVRGGILVGEHGVERLYLGNQGGRVVSNSDLRNNGRRQAANVEVHVHNNAGVQVDTQQDSDGNLHLLLERVTERAAQRGAERGHAMVTNDLRSGTGRAASALKARGVNLGNGPKRN